MSFSAGPSSTHFRSSLLPESSTYSVRNAGTRHRLSSTTQRQLRHQHALTNGNGVLTADDGEEETPTERLRRLTYETQELEEQLEQEAIAKKQQRQAAGLQEDKTDDEDEWEQQEDDTLSLRDDADKTRPPPDRRRRKKKQVDDKGELSSSLLLQQLKRLRGNLNSLEQQEQQLYKGKGKGTEHGNDSQTRDLLQRLANDGMDKEGNSSSKHLMAEGDNQSSTSHSYQTADVHRFDSRLSTLEQFVGASDADADEVSSIIFDISSLSRPYSIGKLHSLTILYQSRPLPPPLLSTLARLEHQLQLLTQPRHLDTISRRVKTLVTDLERVHEARRKIGDTRPLNVALSSGITISTGPPGSLPITSPPPATASASSPGQVGGTAFSIEAPLPPDALQKIDGLFNILPRIEPLLPLTPQLLARLRSLASLHDSAGTFASDLQANEQNVIALKQSETMLEQLLSSLKDSLSANEELTKRNLESLEARLEQVTKQVQNM